MRQTVFRGLRRQAACVTLLSAVLLSVPGLALAAASRPQHGGADDDTTPSSGSAHPNSWHSDAVGDTKIHRSFGARVMPLDSATRSAFDIPGRIGGVAVISVDPTGPAAEAGIRVGDVIEIVGDTWIAGPRDFDEALSQAPQPTVRLTVYRQARTLVITATLS